jgi:hypothetical protein
VRVATPEGNERRAMAFRIRQRAVVGPQRLKDGTDRAHPLPLLQAGEQLQLRSKHKLGLYVPRFLRQFRISLDSASVALTWRMIAQERG